MRNTLHSSLMQGKALVLSVTWLHMLLIWVCFLTLSAGLPDAVMNWTILQFKAVQETCMIPSTSCRIWDCGIQDNIFRRF